MFAFYSCIVATSIPNAADFSQIKIATLNLIPRNYDSYSAQNRRRPTFFLIPYIFQSVFNGW